MACWPLCRCVAGLVLITRYPLGPFKPLDDVVRQLLVPLFRSARIWQLFVISALAGIGEEFLFRGVVQAGAEQFFGSPWLALADRQPVIWPGAPDHRDICRPGRPDRRSIWAGFG